MFEHESDLEPHLLEQVLACWNKHAYETRGPGMLPVHTLVDEFKQIVSRGSAQWRVAYHDIVSKHGPPFNVTIEAHDASFRPRLVFPATTFASQTAATTGFSVEAREVHPAGEPPNGHLWAPGNAQAWRLSTPRAAPAGVTKDILSQSGQLWIAELLRPGYIEAYAQATSQGGAGPWPVSGGLVRVALHILLSEELAGAVSATYDHPKNDLRQTLRALESRLKVPVLRCADWAAGVQLPGRLLLLVPIHPHPSPGVREMFNVSASSNTPRLRRIYRAALAHATPGSGTVHILSLGTCETEDVDHPVTIDPNGGNAPRTFQHQQDAHPTVAHSRGTSAESEYDASRDELANLHKGSHASPTAPPPQQDEVEHAGEATLEHRILAVWHRLAGENGLVGARELEGALRRASILPYERHDDCVFVLEKDKPISVYFLIPTSLVKFNRTADAYLLARPSLDAPVRIERVEKLARLKRDAIANNFVIKQTGNAVERSSPAAPGRPPATQPVGTGSRGPSILTPYTRNQSQQPLAPSPANPSWGDGRPAVADRGASSSTDDRYQYPAIETRQDSRTQTTIADHRPNQAGPVGRLDATPSGDRASLHRVAPGNFDEGLWTDDPQKFRADLQTATPERGRFSPTPSHPFRHPDQASIHAILNCWQDGTAENKTMREVRSELERLPGVTQVTKSDTLGLYVCALGTSTAIGVPANRNFGSSRDGFDAATPAGIHSKITAVLEPAEVSVDGTTLIKKGLVSIVD